MAKVNYQTREYRGYKVISYKATRQTCDDVRGHWRISKVVRPDGSVVNGLDWGYKYQGAYPTPSGTNIGHSPEDAVSFVRGRIDHELDGTETEGMRIARMRKEYRAMVDKATADAKAAGGDELAQGRARIAVKKAYEAEYGLIPGVNCIW